MKYTRLPLEDLMSIMESALFVVSRPLSVQDFSKLFAPEEVSVSQIKQALDKLSKRNQNRSYGLELKEVAGAYQLRTKEENKDYVSRLIKGRLFQLSDPALEVLSVIAYQQPCTKGDVDESRGVESGHLIRTLMEKDLVCFGGKSSQPGRPMTYKTTRKFLEIFGLKSLKDLPALEDIKDLLPSDSLPTAVPKLKTVINDSETSDLDFQKQKSITEELESVSRRIQSISSDMPVKNALKPYEKEN